MAKQPNKDFVTREELASILFEAGARVTGIQVEGSDVFTAKEEHVEVEHEEVNADGNYTWDNFDFDALEGPADDEIDE